MILVCFAVIEIKQEDPLQNNGKKYIVILIGLVVVFLHFSSAIIFLLIEFGIQSRQVVTLAKLMGWFSVIIVAIQWVPQIVVTYRNQGSGALSMYMMILYASSSLFIFCYLIILMKLDASSCFSYLFGGLQQTFICIMCFYFDYKSVKDSIV